jgi:hypothetical protein
MQPVRQQSGLVNRSAYELPLLPAWHVGALVCPSGGPVWTVRVYRLVVGVYQLAEPVWPWAVLVCLWGKLMSVQVVLVCLSALPTSRSECPLVMAVHQQRSLAMLSSPTKLQ